MNRIVIKQDMCRRNVAVGHRDYFEIDAEGARLRSWIDNQLHLSRIDAEVVIEILPAAVDEQAELSMRHGPGEILADPGGHAIARALTGHLAHSSVLRTGKAMRT